MFLRQRHDFLQPRQKRGKGSNDDALPLGLGKEPVKRFGDDLLRFGAAGPVSICTVGNQCQDSLTGQLSKCFQVRRATTGWRLV